MTAWHSTFTDYDSLPSAVTDNLLQDNKETLEILNSLILKLQPQILVLAVNLQHQA
jgi:hypothetical protein